VIEQLKQRLAGFGRSIRQGWQRVVNTCRQAFGRVIGNPRPVRRVGDRPVSDQTTDITRIVSGHRRKRLPPIRRRSRQRVYRLKGYTTVAKINRRRQSERQQRFLRQLLIILIIVLTMILLFNLYNPIKDLGEWYRIIGIKDLSDLAGGTATSQTTRTTTSTTTGQTTTTITSPTSQP
jgi:hypothetical protein